MSTETTNGTLATTNSPPPLFVARIDVERIGQADTETLKDELTNALRVTVAQLVYAAALWRELKSRNVDLSDLMGGVGRWIDMIAAGVLLPEAVVEWVGQTQTLTRLAKCPLDQQRAAVENKRLPWGDGPARRRSAASRFRDDDPDCAPRDHNPVAMAAHANPRDLAETILAMIKAAGSPREVAARILPELNKVLGGRQVVA